VIKHVLIKVEPGYTYDLENGTCDLFKAVTSITGRVHYYKRKLHPRCCKLPAVAAAFTTKIAE